MNRRILLATGLVSVVAMACVGGLVLVGRETRMPAVKATGASRGLDLLEQEGHRLSSARWRELLRQNFAVWRGRPEPMPSSLRRQVRGTLDQNDIDLQFDRAQHVDAPKGGAWLVAGQGIACITQTTAAAVACDTVRRITRYGLGLGTYAMQRRQGERRPWFQLLALVPDWAVAAVLKIKKDLRVPVTHNLVAYGASQPVRLRYLTDR